MGGNFKWQIFAGNLFHNFIIWTINEWTLYIFVLCTEMCSGELLNDRSVMCSALVKSNILSSVVCNIWHIKMKSQDKAKHTTSQRKQINYCCCLAAIRRWKSRRNKNPPDRSSIFGLVIIFPPKFLYPYNFQQNTGDVFTLHIIRLSRQLSNSSHRLRARCNL